MKRLFLLAAVIIGFSCSGEDWQKVKLRFENPENLNMTDSMVTIPAVHVQTDGLPLKIEGEAFSNVSFQNSLVRVVKNPECSGKKCLERARMLEYRIRIATPGCYTVWVRARFPSAAFWNHSERMDGGDQKRIIDSDRLTPNVWHWCKGQTYFLEKGDHLWEFPSPSAWCGGAELDYVVFVPEGKTAADGVSDVQICREGTVVGRRIKTKLIKQWKFDFSMEPNGGEIAVEYGYDKNHFRPVEPEKVYTPEGEYLYFRIRMKTAKDASVSPWLYNPCLSIVKTQVQ